MLFSDPGALCWFGPRNGVRNDPAGSSIAPSRKASRALGVRGMDRLSKGTGGDLRGTSLTGGLEGVTGPSSSLEETAVLADLIIDRAGVVRVIMVDLLAACGNALVFTLFEYVMTVPAGW